MTDAELLVEGDFYPSMVGQVIRLRLLTWLNYELNVC